ncbi:MAG: zinc-ribbon domain-containing protein, partial [Methanothermobacter sp.]|nr:zinc-ribbon domain-containing protein [Methanothermobacter sp.]
MFLYGGIVLKTCSECGSENRDGAAFCSK